MYARLVTGSIAPDKLDEAIELWRDLVAPSVRRQPGFKSVRLMVDHQTGKVASLGRWETEAHVQGTVAWNQQQIGRFAGLFDAPPTVGLYEIVAEA